MRSSRKERNKRIELLHTHLELMVEQEGEPVGEHLLGDRLVAPEERAQVQRAAALDARRRTRWQAAVEARALRATTRRVRVRVQVQVQREAAGCAQAVDRLVRVRVALQAARALVRRAARLADEARELLVQERHEHLSVRVHLRLQERGEQRGEAQALRHGQAAVRTLRLESAHQQHEELLVAQQLHELAHRLRHRLHLRRIHLHMHMHMHMRGARVHHSPVLALLYLPAYP